MGSSYVLTPRSQPSRVLGSTVPVSSGPSAFLNEPVGYTLITDLDGTGYPIWPAVFQNWHDDDSSSTADTMTNPTDATAPHTASVVSSKYLKGLFSAGPTPPAVAPGSGPFSLFRSFTSGEQFNKLFIGTWVRHETGWNPDPGNLGKTGVKFFWPACDSDGGTQLYTGFDHTHGGMDFGLIQQSAIAREMYCNIGSFSNGNVLGRIGSWVKIEILLQMNSANGVADGSVDIWIDDIHTHSYGPAGGNIGLGIDFVGTAGRKFLSFKWAPTFGGAGGSPLVNQWEDVSQIHLSGHA